MQILAHKQTLTFTNHGRWVPTDKKDPSKGGRYEGGSSHSVTITPKTEIQTVPDWIAENDGFLKAEKYGLIARIAVLSPPIEKKAAPALPASVPGLEASEPEEMEEEETEEEKDGPEAKQPAVNTRAVRRR